MPQTTIQLAGNPTRRAYLTVDNTTKDRRMNACFVEASDTPATQDRALFVSKRAGLITFATPAPGIEGTRIFYSHGTSKFYASFGDTGTNDTVYQIDANGTVTTLGGITGFVSQFSDIEIGGVIFIMMVSTDQTGWFWASDATDTSFSGDTHSNTTVDNITGLTGTLYPGMAISGTGIPAGTRIASVQSATAITLTQAATGTATVALTVSLVAKIIDANFPTNITGMFAPLGGYVFIMTTTGRIYNSNLGVVYTYSASGYIPANSFTDGGKGCIKYQNYIAAFGTNSVEFFENVGFASGSPLQKVPQEISNIGMINSTTAPPTISGYCAGHGTVFWTGNDGNLYKLNGFSAERITESPFSLSTPTLLTAFSHMKKRFVSIGTSTSIAQWYDVDMGQFVYPSFNVPCSIVGPDSNGICAAILYDDSGKVLRLLFNSQALFTDDGVAYAMELRTGRNYLNGGMPFIINNINLVADTEASGSAVLATSADDYANFGTVGSFDMTKQQKRLPGGGYYDSNAVFKITHSSPTPFRAQALIVDWEPA